MSEQQHPGRVEDYTQPFLVTTCLILFMGFWVIASLYGFFGVVLAAAGIDLCVKAIGRRTGAA